MSGWTRKINWSHWMRLKVLALALVSAALFAAAASAKPPEIPYLSHGTGVSQGEIGAQFTLNTSGTDPYQQDWRQVLSEQSASAYQTSTSSGGVTPTNLARAYIQRDEGVAVAAPVDGRSFELGDAALGFGLGLLLASGCAVAIVLSRRGMRMAHS
jgi:hypothetical protein